MRRFVVIAALVCPTLVQPGPELDSVRRALATEHSLGEVRLPFQAPELVDPRQVFPDLSRHPLDDLAALFRYSRSCNDDELAEVRHPTLTKATTWHRFLCHPSRDLPPGFFHDGPRYHPGGSSFVALAARSGRTRFGGDWLREQGDQLHVLESGLLLSAGLELDDDRRLLHRLAPQTLRRLVDREALVVDRELVFLLATTHGALDPGVYSVYPVDRYLAAMQVRETDPRHGWLALALAVGAGFLLLVLLLVQAIRRMRFRRMLMHERARVLRTLAHEVRTPTSSLKLVLEELRTDYDDLPPSAQKGFLALCDEVHRLEQVIRESGRYLGAFRKDPSQAYRRVTIDSVNDFVAGVLETHRDRLTFEPLTGDTGIVTDPYWFAVCIRNLVDNALTHGAPPVVVRLDVDRRRLHLTVTDGGQARARQLQQGLRPFLRAHASPGLGLGLPIVADTVSGLRGKLTWHTRPTRFTMSLRRLS